MENAQLSQEQYQLFKTAETYLKRKRRLYIHFGVFALGSVFFFVANKLLNFAPQYDWYLWLSFVWLFFWGCHAMDVFVFHPFLGKEWQQKQRQKLIEIQQQKIIQMQAAIEKEFELQKEQAKKQLEAPLTPTP